MEIFLNSHGYKPEPFTAKTHRTFLRGHMFEKALWDGYDEENPAIWPTLGKIKDYDRGIEMDTSEWIVSGRQDEVEVSGIRGHLDAVLTHKTDGRVLVPDSKAVGCTSYRMTLTGDLLKNHFSRQYVCQLHGYRKGRLLQGKRVDGMLLVYYNVCSSEIMFRVVDYSPTIDEEIPERLSWVTSGSEPTPEHEWVTGQPVPTACGYCNQKANCAALRGVNLVMGFSKKGAPEWKAA